jgi:hypothetical protein
VTPVWATVGDILRATLAVEAVARRLGYGLTTDATGLPECDPAQVQGYTDYAGRVIWVCPTLPFAEALLTLLHEVGHAVAAERMGYGVRHDRTFADLDALMTGEPRAYLYGWGVACRLGLTHDEGITRDLWRLFHEMPVTDDVRAVASVTRPPAPETR